MPKPSDFEKRLRDLLIRRERLSRSDAAQIAGNIASIVTAYQRDSRMWLALRETNRSADIRDWLADVIRHAAALDACLRQHHIPPPDPLKSAEKPLALPMRHLHLHMPADDLAWLESVRSDTERQLECWRQQREPAHRRKDLARYAMESDIASELELAGIVLTHGVGGTLTRIFEYVHGEIGLKGNAHKSARIAHGERKSKHSSAVPELARKKS